MESREEMIKRVQEMGQSIIDNAEDIVGNVRYIKGLTITCYPAYMDEPPYYTVDRDIIPELFISRMSDK